MPRMPAGTPYMGPSACYDDMIEPDQLIRRLAYGRPAPLLRPFEQIITPFWGKLLDALSNQHAVLIRVYRNRASAGPLVKKLREELPADRFAVHVTQDRDLYGDDWHVIVYNVIRVKDPQPRRLSAQERKAQWVGTAHVSRILKLDRDGTRKAIALAGIETRRTGGRNEIMIRQSDIPKLVTRPGRWRKRAVKPEDRIRL